MKKIKVIILILILFLIGQPVLAKTPTLCERTEDNHYQVNKKWPISDKNLSNVTNTPCVDANEKIYDFSEVLTEEEYKNLQEKMNKYVAKTNMDIVIVIDNVYYLSDSTNETYASDFYDYNDFGLDFDYYSGTLFFRNTYEQDPYYNIYTFGEAQLYYSYNRLENILDYVYDDIHSGNYYKAKEASRKARTWAIVSACVGAFWVILYIIIVVVALLSEGSSEILSGFQNIY